MKKSANMWVWLLGLAVVSSSEEVTYNGRLRQKPWVMEPRLGHRIKLVPARSNNYIWAEVPPRSIDVDVYFTLNVTEPPIEQIVTQAARSCIYVINPAHLGEGKYAIEGNADDVGTTTCTDGLTNLGAMIGREILCGNAKVRIPLADTWDFWRSLDQRDKTNGARPRRVWASISEERLEQSLLGGPNSSPYHADGTRKAYLQYDLPKNIRSALNAWLHQPVPRNSSLHLCYANIDESKRYTRVLNIGTVEPRVASEINSSLASTETTMRVFFEPGWRLRKSIRGTNLEMTDRLAIKLNECDGKMDDLVMRIIKPIVKTVVTYPPFPNSSITQAPPPPRSIDVLDFDVTVTPINERDATSDWRRAAYILRRAQRRSQMATATKAPGSKPTGSTRKVRERTASDEGLKMTLCYYRDSNDLRGVFVGSTTYTLASSDAAEFVALSIFFLLWLPVCCMWTIGCLGYKHRSLRVHLRRIRLAQQRDQIEARLARYLGYTQKDDESSADELSDSGGRGARPSEVVTPLLSPE